MSNQGLKWGSFCKYYLVSLASLSLLCFAFYGLYSLNEFFPLSLDKTSGLEIKHYSGQSSSTDKKDGIYKVQDFSGQTKSYDVDLHVSNEGDKVVQTYIFEYKK